MQDIVHRQEWSPEVYERNARFVSELGSDVVEWLDPKPGERSLDLGCGDGALTVKLLEAGAEVVGLDSSAPFVEAARARGIDARLGDGQRLDFSHEFDAVFSNAALHWMTDAEATARGVHRALKPGGRFVAECGAHGNVAAIVTGLRAVADRHGIDDRLVSPWYFPTTDAYRRVLEAAGFEVERIVRLARPTPLPSGLAGWLETFRGPFFEAAGVQKERVLGELEALLSPALRDEEGRWTADYIRLRFVAHAR